MTTFFFFYCFLDLVIKSGKFSLQKEGALLRSKTANCSVFFSAQMFSDFFVGC